MQVIIGTSWNGTPFIYNVEKGTWDNMHSITVGAEHNATGADLYAAQQQAIEEGARHIADSAAFETYY
jgi:hypothetical protein